jgi:hypothetical protein
MADKNFGVKGINFISDPGTPTISIASSTISYAGSLNLNADTVAISTNISIGGSVVSNIIVSNAYSVGIGTTNPTSKLWVQGDVRVSGTLTASNFVGSGVLVKVGNEWKIQHYVLSMTIPNDATSEAIKIKSPLENPLIEKLKSK